MGPQTTIKPFPVEQLRPLFPALASSPDFTFFDNAAGAQIPQTVLSAVNRHLIDRNVQRGGRFAKSRQLDEAIGRARESVATFLNARDPNEVAFGMNATSFIRVVSLGIGEDLKKRNEIILTNLDHEANISTWLTLQQQGATFRWWNMREDGNLHLEDLQPLLSSRTRLVACTVASNALGNVVDVAAAASLAHDAGAEIFLDCVHYAPHGSIDVQSWQCDYLTCSGYKIFAPHMGFLWGRYEALVRLSTFREEFVVNEPPHKIEAGTFVYENVVGMDGAIGYLEDLGRMVTGGGTNHSRRALLLAAMEAIRSYEETLSLEVLKVLEDCEAAVYGVNGRSRVNQRVPTILFNIEGTSPAVIAEELATSGFGVRDGHMYSPRLMKHLGLSPDSGAVRVSLVHYNTFREIKHFGSALREIVDHQHNGHSAK
jgi:cysteine desulfurase family protein (TIGR01976 family)